LSGTQIENRLKEHDEKGNPLHRLEDLLADDKPVAPEPQFRSFAGMPIRKVKIKEDGTWD